MLRLIVIASLFTAATSTDVLAQRAGTEGTVTAYELDGQTVIDTKHCFRTGRHSTYDYSRCSNRLRDSMKISWCRQKGSGTHWYMYQWGNGRISRTSLFCSRRY